MLCRVAEDLYWMSRYVERGIEVSRLIDVTRELELDAGTGDVWAALVGAIALAQWAVSEHVSGLGESEVWQSTVQGHRTYYGLVASTLGRFESTVGELRESRHVPREPGTVC